MDPFDFLKSYSKDNPTAAGILFGAIACFAAVAAIVKFGIDPEATVPSVIYVLIVGAAFYLLVRFLDEPVARRGASYFFALLVAGWIAAFFWSRAHPHDEEFACAVYFWKPCVVTADDVTSESASRPKLTTPSTGGIGADQKGQYQVYLQFAGYDRDTIVALATALSKQGWNVQGQSRGGERTGNAAGLAEIRYADASSKPAADALAAAINASKVSGKTIKAVQLSIIKPKVLEVWISQ